MEKFKGIALLLCGICIGIFVLQALLPSFTDLISLSQASWWQPWRFVTALVAHGSLGHLLYNIFALALFGSILEVLLGGRKFLAVFFSTGIVANVLALLVYPNSLGASGAIFGIIGTLVILRPGMVVFAFGLPMPMFIAAALWAIGDIIGLFVPSNIGNVAHLAGLALGLLCGALARHYQPSPLPRPRVVIDETKLREWENRYMR